MKVSYQNYRQQKQSSKVMRTYIVQAATKGATEEELDILCQAYLLEQKYGFNYYGWSKDTVSDMSIVRIGSDYMIDVPRAVHFFQMR